MAVDGHILTVARVISSEVAALPTGPSKRWYAVGGAVLGAGVVGAIVTFCVLLANMSHRVEGWRRLAVPGLERVQLAAGNYTLYHEHPQGSGATAGVCACGLTVRDPAGVPVPFDSNDSSLAYTTFGGLRGTSIGNFHATQSGTYVIGSDVATGDVVIGRDLTGTFAAIFVVPALVVVLLAGPGLAMVVVTGIRRSRARKCQMPQVAWTSGPPQAWTASPTVAPTGWQPVPPPLPPAYGSWQQTSPLASDISDPWRRPS